jgi:hypothetical protein
MARTIREISADLTTAWQTRKFAFDRMAELDHDVATLDEFASLYVLADSSLAKAKEELIRYENSKK